MQVDMIICTKDPASIRRDLLGSLEAPWVRSVIIETSKPLSYARVSGAKKAQGKWVGFVDDSVVVPFHWYYDLMAYADNPGVVAVDSESCNWNRDEIAFALMASKLKSMMRGAVRGRDWDNRAFIIRRDAVLSWDPPPVFYLEDELLHIHATQLGRWVHLPFNGVKHFGRSKSRVPFAYGNAVFNCYAKRGRNSIIALSKAVLFMGTASLLAVAYSRTIMTWFFYLGQCVQTVAGYLLAKLDGF